MKRRAVLGTLAGIPTAIKTTQTMSGQEEITFSENYDWPMIGGRRITRQDYNNLVADIDEDLSVEIGEVIDEILSHDHEGDTLTPDEVQAAEANIDRHPGLQIIAGGNEYPTINEAIDNAATQETILCKIQRAQSPDFNETVEFVGGHRSIEAAGGQGSVKVFSSGGHVFKMQDNDQEVKGFWIEQEDEYPMEYDAISVTGKEARIVDCGIDAAPRYGILLDNANESMIRATEITNYGISGIRLRGSSHCNISDVQVKSSYHRSAAIHVQQDCDNNHISGVIRSIDGHGLIDNVGPLGAGGNHYDLAIHNVTENGVNLGRFANLRATITDTGERGLVIGGRENTATVNIQNPGTAAVVINGDNNTVNVTSDGGNVIINGDNNVVMGSVDNGQLNDHGNNNNTAATVNTP